MDKFLRFMIIFLGSYLLLMFLFPPEKQDDTKPKDDIEITLADDTPVMGDLIEIQVKNNLTTDLDLGAGTPPEKLNIEKYANGEWVRMNISDIPENTTIDSLQQQTFAYPDNNTAFFDEEGKYRVRIEMGEKEFFEEINVENPGIFKTIWRTFFWKPVYNGMIFFLEITGKNLGWAIVLLTLLIKLLLFIPTHKGMKAQRTMQKLQPELQKIKARNPGNQQKIALDTMELWKKHNVSPFASIMPMLLQFPFLIALFYVIQDGLSHEKSFFLYSWFSDFNYDGIVTNFLNILPLLKTPLEHIYSLWLPIVVAIVQYFAMKLAFAKMKEQREKNKNAPKPEGFMADFQNEFQKMNGVFIYVLPVMVMGFTAFLPAAVGLYWFVSTLFSIGQQYVVNKTVDND